MNRQQIEQEIAAGEGLHREFKEARERLPRNVFESVAAFLNTDGGTLLLGVADDGTITGVDASAVDPLKSELASLSNNPQKIDPPYLLFPHAFEFEGKTVIAVQVPLSSQLHKTKGDIYLRSEDGDYRAHGTHQLAGLINRKLSLFTEQRAQPFVTMEDLRPELFDRARRLMRSYNPQHHFGEITPENLRPFSKNPTLCKFMIQLGRFDELGSGVTNIHKYLPYYAPGATPHFKETTHGFELTIPLQAETAAPQVTPQVTPQVAGEVTGEVAGEVERLLQALKKPLSRTALQQALGLKSQANFRERSLKPALQMELIEMTIPDKPNSRLQKYRLTAKGENVLKTLDP